MAFDRNNHEQAVADFLAGCRIDNPEKYQEIASRTPLVTRKQSQEIRKREVVVGLLGAQPSRINPEAAQRHDYESVSTEGTE